MVLFTKVSRQDVPKNFKLQLYIPTILFACIDAQKLLRSCTNDCHQLSDPLMPKMDYVIALAQAFQKRDSRL
jgi:hypothetical protein